jgi:hypothetical protein
MRSGPIPILPPQNQSRTVETKRERLINKAMKIARDGIKVSAIVALSLQRRQPRRSCAQLFLNCNYQGLMSLPHRALASATARPSRCEGKPAWRLNAQVLIDENRHKLCRSFDLPQCRRARRARSYNFTKDKALRRQRNEGSQTGKPAVPLSRRAIADGPPRDRRSTVFKEEAMITLEDCLAFCGLTEEEVLAIAEHEHLPVHAATAYAQYLLNKERGLEEICQMIADDIRAAQARGDRAHVQTLLHVLHHFIRAHPEAAPRMHPWHRVI